MASFAPQMSLDGRIDRHRTAFLIVPLAVVLASAVFYDHNVSYSAYYLLAIVGILSVGWGAARGLTREEWAVVLATAGVVFTGWLSYAYNGFEPDGWGRFLEAQTPVLGLVPIFFLARRYGMAAAVWTASAAGAIACGLLILAEITAHFQSSPLTAIAKAWNTGYRVSAGDHPLPLAFTSLVFGAVVAAGWRWFARFKAVGWAVWGAALSLGGLALMLSGTRGAWIAIPAFLFVYLALRWERLGRWRKVSVIVFLVLTPLLALQSNTINKRFERATAEAVRYANRTSTRDVTTSIGARFDTFSAAWNAFLERPLLGYGSGGWPEAFSEAKQQGVSQGTLLPNPHNMYLSSLALRGVVGFAAEMVFLLAFAYLFGRRVRDGKGGLVGDLALAGLLVTVAILVMGLTWVPFGWWRKQTILLSFLLACIFGAIRFLERQAMSQEESRT